MKRSGIFIAVALSLALCLALAGCNFDRHNAYVPDDSPAAHRDVAGATTKKGVSVSRYGNGSAQGNANLSSLGASWYYNWSMEPVNGLDMEFVPMLHGLGNMTDGDLARIKAGYESGAYKYLLVFNEPDGDYSGGGNPASVEDALAVWPKLEEIGIPLSSPAVTNPFQANGKWNDWFDAFMTGAKQRGYRIDFIAIHYYQDFSLSGAHSTLRSQLLKIYEKYELPIWITEFGCIDISTWNPNTPGGNPACTLSAATSYTKNVTDMLESLGFVERYAWFLDNFNQHGSSRPSEAAYTSLFNDDDTISETGIVYRDRVSRHPLSIDTETLPTAKKGEFLSFKFTACGGEGDYRFSSVPPTGVTLRAVLPRGLSLSPSGELYGTPQADGEYTLCVTVTDAENQQTYRVYSFIVEE